MRYRIEAYTMMIGAALLASVAWSPVARAQLIGDEVQGTQRVCTYYGSDLLPNDETVARTLSVGSGQNCPATAPYRDPNTPVPFNARLIGETTTGSGRTCTYEQAGVKYPIARPIDSACAMTPALNGR